MGRWLIYLFGLILFPVFSAGGWVDPVYGFSIDVPGGWRTQESNTGQMRNLIMLNRDESVGAGVMSIDAGAPLTLDQWIELIEPMFLSDILEGGVRENVIDHTQNNLAGKYAFYRGMYRNGREAIPAVARIFYTKKGNIGYIVWCVVPEGLSATHLSEAERIVSTFSFGYRGGGIGEKLFDSAGSSGLAEKSSQIARRTERTENHLSGSRQAPALSFQGGQSLGKKDRRGVSFSGNSDHKGDRGKTDVLKQLRSEYAVSGSEGRNNEAAMAAGRLYGVDYADLVLKAADGDRKSIATLRGIKLDGIAGVIHDEVLFQLKEGLGVEAFSVPPAEPEKDTERKQKKSAGVVRSFGGSIGLQKRKAAHSEGEELKGRAKVKILCDLDGDGRREWVLTVPCGENENGKFYRLIVLDPDGAVVWSGPANMNMNDPLIFGEWDFGISMPEIVGDIDADGTIELVAPAPQSDVSPTSFRVLRWQNGAFRPVFVSVLMETPRNSGSFPWSNTDQYEGVWISDFISMESPGSLTVNVTEYMGGADAKMRKAQVRGSRSGFKVEHWLEKNDGSTGNAAGLSRSFGL